MTSVTRLPPQKVPFVLPDGKVNPVWYRFMQARFANTADVAAVEAGVDAVQEDFDQVGLQWGVSVNVDNRVTGAIRLDGAISQSVFAVLADRFIVVHPGNDGLTVEAFAAGLVNGVPTVGVNGNIVIDGSILARHIDVSTLSALAADIGEVTAGVARSADGKFVIDFTSKTLTITT